MNFTKKLYECPITEESKELTVNELSELSLVLSLS